MYGQSFASAKQPAPQELDDARNALRPAAQLRFLPEPRFAVAAAPVPRDQDLQGHIATAAPVVHAVHRAHPAFAQEAADLEALVENLPALELGQLVGLFSPPIGDQIVHGARPPFLIFAATLGFVPLSRTS